MVDVRCTVGVFHCISWEAARPSELNRKITYQSREHPKRRFSPSSFYLLSFTLSIELATGLDR